jgi:hypothetical protein
MKRIVICADGTWDKPEEDPEKDAATNVLHMASAIRPVDSTNIHQAASCARSARVRFGSEGLNERSGPDGGTSRFRPNFDGPRSI